MAHPDPPFFVVVTRNREAGRSGSQVPPDIQAFVRNLHRNRPDMPPQDLWRAIKASEPDRVRELGEGALMSLIHAITGSR